MLIPVLEIQVKEGRRELNTEHVRELADSIRELGLLNPITIDKEHALIAGLHRLEAVKLLEWPEVECTVSSLEGLQAELAEIDENFVRNDISALEYGDMLLRRKEIYETLHPETKAGVSQAAGMNRSVGNNVREPGSPTSKSFISDTAEKLGVTPRTIAKRIQVAKNLTPETKEIVKENDVGFKNALKLSRLEPEQQKEAATLLAAREIKTVDECRPAGPVEPEPESAEDGVREEEPEDTAPGGSIPYTLQGKHFATFKESIADLKDPNKDCSCTPDSFLAEITAFVQKFRREIEWYSTPYYEVVFSCLSPVQRDYLQQQTNTICSAAEHLYRQTERNAKQ